MINKLIEERHSVRTYKRRKIANDKIAQLRKYINEMNRESGLHIQYVDSAAGVYNSIAAKLLGWKNVPALIALVGKDDEELGEKCGYFGEKIVLFAQQIGLNTCWAGMFKKSAVRAETGEGEKLLITIAIGYGANQGKAHKSKPIEEVVSVNGEMPDWFRKGAEMALLAPTAINQQKFRFVLNDDGSVTGEVSGKGPFIDVDLGIVKYHFEAGSGRKVK